MSFAMADLPLSDRFGSQLVSVRFAAEAELGALEDPVVTPLSLIVVICAGEILMVLDRHRRQWELPGGIRERGESARQAASRELAETGISAADLGFAAVAGFSLVQSPQREFAAVYRTMLPTAPPLRTNEEIEDFRWWDPRSPLRDEMSPLDAEIGSRVASRPVP
jgi:8-oxo-dGTP pyrophosphatase MutT (NUDIX family)